MIDVVSPEVRSRMMSGVRGKNTRPELLLRSNLHKLGFRFRIHDRSLPGKPDLVFRKRRAVLFAHGCFWHQHNCQLFKWPKSRKKFWRKKITRNRENDLDATTKLHALGWRVGIVWECALKGTNRLPLRDTIAVCERWLRSNEPYLEIKGNPRDTKS